MRVSSSSRKNYSPISKSLLTDYSQESIEEENMILFIV